MKNTKAVMRLARHNRIRARMKPDKERLRVVVHPSLNNFSAQVVDDINKKTILSLSTFNKEIKQRIQTRGNVKAAEAFGIIFAEKAKEKGIKKIIFDRAGYLYHGKVKVFAESLRKAGLDF